MSAPVIRCPVLSAWRDAEAERLNACLPHFAATSRAGAPLLALFETPAKSGAARSGECALTNNDPTALFTAQAVKDAGLRPEHIVIWNVRAAFDSCDLPLGEGDWADHYLRLVEIMPNLRAILLFGGTALKTARRMSLGVAVPLLGAPHASRRGRSSSKDAEELIRRAWRRAARLVEQGGEPCTSA